MAIPLQKGYYNPTTQKIYPASTSTWSGLSGKTWDNWTQWQYSSDTEIVWYTVQETWGAIAKDFTLNITTVSNASITYYVYTSMSGDFQGEETERIINPGDTAVPSFNGRWLWVVVKAEQINDLAEISEITVTPIMSDPVELTYNSLNTSTLDGTVNARVLPVVETLSQVVDMKITPHQTDTPYNLDVYVTNTPTSTYLIPKIISKNPSAPTFALVGVDNHPRDGVVDITIKALPEQYRDGNDLKTRV